MHDGGLPQEVEREVIDEVAVGQMRCVVRRAREIDEATMSVIGVLAETHVRDDHQFWRDVLDRADRTRHNAVRIVVVAP